MPPVIPPLHFPVLVIAPGPRDPQPEEARVSEQSYLSVTPPPFLNQTTAILGPHWKAVEESTLRTPGLTTERREQLADAYRSSANFGSLEQLYTARAVEHLCLFADFLDPLDMALTVHIHEGLANAPAARLPAILRTMEEGVIEQGHDLSAMNSKRRENRARILSDIRNRVDERQPLSEKVLRDILLSTGFVIPEAVSLLVKPGHEFDDKVAQWGATAGGANPYGCRNTLFRRIQGRKEIWVRDVEPATRGDTVRQWVDRLVALPHETEHALQDDFRDRVTSEVLAGLAENRWRMENYDIDTWILASRMRLKIVQYLKLMARWAYPSKIIEP